jgi:hypothetical protein
MLFKLINLLIDALVEEHIKADSHFKEDLWLCIVHLKNIKKYF